MTLINHGTAVVEPGEEGCGVLVMLPDGTIEGAKNEQAALKIVRRWHAKVVAADRQSGHVTVEYRGGLTPPKE